MSKTFVKGRKNYKRIGHKYGHCLVCGYEPRRKAQRKNQEKIMFKVDIIPYLVLEGIISRD